MTDYGQFCPVAKASGLLGERWTILIIRELVLGTTRFSEFQRALSKISPTLLTKRLNQLEEAGIVIKKTQGGRKGFCYYLTPAGKELSPIIEHLAIWGMRWARGQLNEEELDVEFLMWELQRRLQCDALPDGETVIGITFAELNRYKSWWLIAYNGAVDLCTENPGKEVDIYLHSTVRTMVEVWEGNLPIKTALRSKKIAAQGNRQLIRSIPDWLGICLYADVEYVGK